MTCRVDVAIKVAGATPVAPFAVIQYPRNVNARLINPMKVGVLLDAQFAKRFVDEPHLPDMWTKSFSFSRQ